MPELKSIKLSKWIRSALNISHDYEPITEVKHELSVLIGGQWNHNWS
jgi:hypothetical protein